MKLAFVELEGFRGFREKARFDLPPGFAVITGRNGVGKSTLFDAIEFALTGTLNKYSVKGAKGGGLHDHIWWVGDGTPKAHYVAVGFDDDNGKRIIVRRTREHGLDKDGIEISHLLRTDGQGTEVWWLDNLMQTTLIRDETIASLSLDLPQQARFTAVRAAISGLAGTDHTGRTSALYDAAKKFKNEQELRLNTTRDELGRTLSALTEARSAAEHVTDVSEALQIIASLEPNLVTSTQPVDRAESIRARIANRRLALSLLQEGIERAVKLRADMLLVESPMRHNELVEARAVLEKARVIKSQSDLVVQAAERVITKEREVDEFAAHMAALLEHGAAVGLQDGHCPLCAAARTPKVFVTAISAAKLKLADHGARLTAAASELTKALSAANKANQDLVAATARITELEQQRVILIERLSALQGEFNKLNFSASPSDPDGARRMLLPLQEQVAQLQRALFIIEASGAQERVAIQEGRVAQLRTQVDQEAAKLSTAEHVVEMSRQIDASASIVANEVLAEQFDTVMPLLKELYRRLRPHTNWREIESDFGGQVRASLNFTVGNGHNPQFMFSSGQRRAAGIAFLLAIHLSRPWCHWRSLLMDDPVQHIDDYRALNLVEVLSAIRRTGRQIIIAVEDSALADLLCRRLRSSLNEIGRRFELETARNGSAIIASESAVLPMPRETLRAAEAS